MCRNIVTRFVILLCLIKLAENLKQEAYFKKVNVNHKSNTFTIEKSNYENATILIAITINNNAYSLPTFLKTLETLKCLNNRHKCDLW